MASKTVVDTDFARGRQLALSLLAEGNHINRTDANSAAALRWHRGGQEQRRFAEAHLQKLIDDPSLLDGFAAVLSSALGEDVVDARHFAVLRDAEYQGGRPGADGTARAQ